MKDNKTTQIILIILVCTIWGTVAYKFSTFGNKVEIPTLRKFTEIAQSEPNEEFAFTLNLNYFDPFFKNKFSHKNEHKTKPIKSSKNSVNKSLQKSPTIRYSGFSTDNQNISRARIQVDGKMVTIKKNETKAGIVLSEIYKDSIIIIVEGERSRVNRNN